MTNQQLDAIRAAADRVADRLDADVLIYNGPIERHDSDNIIEQCTKRHRRKNVFLILTTPGGNPHAAYRIARALHQHYSRFIAFVSGYCKSAGTLLVLGAHELVMGPHAELGPLDLQVPRTDEVGERSSVLTPTDGLRVLQQQASNSFISTFMEFRMNAQLPTRLSAEMAATLVGGLFREVFGQVDPMRLGEMERGNRIALEYGQRLIESGKNVQEDALLQLVAGYPSHAFVIDQAEAKELFKNVRESVEDELLLGQKEYLSDERAYVFFVNSEQGKHHDDQNDSAHESADSSSSPSDRDEENAGDAPSSRRNGPDKDPRRSYPTADGKIVESIHEIMS